MRKFRTRTRRARWTPAVGQPRPFRRWVLPVLLRDILIDGGAVLRESARHLGIQRGDGDLVVFLLALAIGGSYALTALGLGAMAGPLVVALGALGGLVFAVRDRERLWLRWRLRHASAGPFVAMCSSIWGVGDWGVYDCRKLALFTTTPDEDAARLQARRLNAALQVDTAEREAVAGEAL